MDDLPLHKVSISGPILASMIQRFISSPGDIEGLLFGRVTHLTITNFSDDTSTSTPDSPTLLATVTSFLSFNSSGDLSPTSVRRLLSSPPFSDHNNSLLGWFSGRRKTPIRPSLRDSSLTASFSSDTQFSLQVDNSSYNIPPCLFFLFTTPIQDQLIHTHEYRAYQFRLSTDSFEPKTIDVVNLGPAFRGHYGSFSPNSPFPAIHCEMKASGSSTSDDGKIDKESLMGMKKFSKDQKELDMVADGFHISRLNSLMGPEAANYTSELDNLYVKMLAKLEKLGRLVEKSSAKVSEQENLNMKLRYKVAGME
ncbi:uncharacterized protein LOC124931595 [Impatiens glandulifera]|uniref:uncharacterized protein LOC124931595 n=1 Tax=Impatiens glandulifera TaxID=253017 RepID=UPI001FB0C586|nr:uncharacterized protein LOC124931595 [Impatiens glandulifera]